MGMAITRKRIAPGIPETLLYESGRHSRLFQLAIVRHFQLRRRDIADGLQERAVVEPVDPLEGRVFHLIYRAPGATLSLFAGKGAR